jgi:hypothetical protein
MFRRKLTGITDGTSHTILLGIKAMATQTYASRGPGRFERSDGSMALRDKFDDPITAAGPGVEGTTRAYGPDTVWWLAGDPGPTDPSDPYKTDLPGSTYRIATSYNWLRYTYVVVRDAPDLDVTNRWGSPYPNGGLFAMADGSVRTINFTTAYQQIIPLLTPTGGEVNAQD